MGFWFSWIFPWVSHEMWHFMGLPSGLHPFFSRDFPGASPPPRPPWPSTSTAPRSRRSGCPMAWRSRRQRRSAVRCGSGTLEETMVFPFFGQEIYGIFHEFPINSRGKHGFSMFWPGNIWFLPWNMGCSWIFMDFSANPMTELIGIWFRITQFYDFLLTSLELWSGITRLWVGCVLHEILKHDWSNNETNKCSKIVDG